MSKKKDKKYGKRSQATINLMKNVRKQFGEFSMGGHTPKFSTRRQSR